MALAFVVGCGGEGPKGDPGDPGAPGTEGPPGPGTVGEGSVSAVSPNIVYLDRQVEVMISGYGTRWSSGVTVDFGPGIAVDQQNIIVASDTSLIVFISVAPDADVTSLRDVNVTDSTGTVTFAGAFVVQPPIANLGRLGTVAQGSLFLVQGDVIDRSTPIDTLEETTLELGQGNSQYVLSPADGEVAPYSFSGLAFVDVNTAPGQKEIVLLNGFQGDPDFPPVSYRFPASQFFDVTPRTPTPIALGTPAVGSFASSLQTHLFEVAPLPTEDVFVQIEAANGEGAAFVLLPPSGRFDDLAQVQFWLGNRVPASNSTDPWYVIAINLDSATGYDFTIETTAVEAETADVCENAAVVPLPANLTGLTLEDDADQDWFAIEVPADALGGTIAVATTAGDANADTILEIFGPDDCLVAFAGPRDQDYHETLVSPELTAAGTYYVKVSYSDYAPYAAGGYNLSINLNVPVGPDTNEPNNTCAMATDGGPLPVSLLDQSLDTATDEDWFSFEVDAAAVGGTFTVATLPGDAQTDTMIEVFGPDDCSVALSEPIDDNYHESYTSDALTAPGTYFVRVSNSPTTTNTGMAYDLSVTVDLPTAPDVHEPNNTCQASTALTLPATEMNLSLIPQTDEDWFAVTLDAAAVGQRLFVVTSPGDDEVDTVVEFFQSDCTTSFGGPSPDLNYQDIHASPVITAAGTYHIKISNSTFGYTGDAYNMQVLLVPASVTESEPNNTSATADSTMGSPDAIGAIGVAGDNDWYAVPLPANVRFVAQVDSGMVNECGVDIDSELEIYSPSGTSLAFSEDISPFGNYCSAALVQITTAGTYYVRIASSTDYEPDGMFDYTARFYYFP
ncbi:hypothetical protein [Chondromyces apiculatus]|uniref:Peptidase C-terminal archaeal/bacterial domain-containing protein n=1 Tax=Chondromyces apiculatus DSM 436 TaxID=1192034 RepID=A0A017TDQ9_9BACT|nr:hypothetical protein [Chondromyces apiculatus]EYF06945.1 Hypothetical protein CAP_1203 [Chondromyces apiculatus DSM 436]